jgi:hypothetical protein
MWVREGPVICGRRIPKWRGDSGGASESLPKNSFFNVAFDVNARVMYIYGYADGQGDTLAEIPFSEILPEEGSWAGYPTGRFDPTDRPIVSFNYNQIKVWVKCYNGGGTAPAPLLRLYTNFHWR